MILKNQTNENKRGILAAIGNTPLIEIIKTNRYWPRVRIFAKLEGANPGGSVKDRPALRMILKAEETGRLDKGKIIIEATSGNTGIALAMIGASRGYRVKLFMSEAASMERRKTMEALGAEIVLTPAAEGTDGAIRRVRQLLDEQPGRYFMPNQFDNEDNTLSHYETTGPEIWRQTKGKVDFFAAGIGTGGTLLGTGRYLKEKNPGLKIIGLEPARNHKIQGLKNMEESIMPGIYHPELLDEKFTVMDEEALEATRMMGKKEGLFVGISSGAALAGALRVARGVKQGNIVTVFPDRGDRYLSTGLFA
ncbi:MAG: cysteine synthase family protein [Candidatus Pacebacteria bacterium]|nr:cysteine synthase family protein [Candidatus Paceibacterota bacterium]